MVDSIIKILEHYGPITGKDLITKSRLEPLSVWRFCITSKQIGTVIIGKRYLRLDKRVKSYARLSPSILREFLTYTIIGLKQDHININKKAELLLKKTTKINNDKFLLAETIIKKVVKSQRNFRDIEENAVFIIAGDIVYNMAHAEIRPEPSTGEAINGSDLDIIIVTDGLSDDIVEKLDKQIYAEKYYLMKNPAYKEEIDYIIKDFAKVEEQLSFDNFEFMVASKILEEGKFLFGNLKLFKKIKKLLSDKHIPEKLNELECIAVKERKRASQYLLDTKNSLSNEDHTRLFFTKEESDEIF